MGDPWGDCHPSHTSNCVPPSTLFVFRLKAVDLLIYNECGKGDSASGKSLLVGNRKKVSRSQRKPRRECRPVISR